MAPNLTIGRWAALRALQDQPILMRRPFIARELKILCRGNHRRPASGATMDALRKAGWAEKITVGGTGARIGPGVRAEVEKKETER